MHQLRHLGAARRREGAAGAGRHAGAAAGPGVVRQQRRRSAGFADPGGGGRRRKAACAHEPRGEDPVHRAAGPQRRVSDQEGGREGMRLSGHLEVHALQRSGGSQGDGCGGGAELMGEKEREAMEAGAPEREEERSGQEAAAQAVIEASEGPIGSGDGRLDGERKAAPERMNGGNMAEKAVEAAPERMDGGNMAEKAVEAAPERGCLPGGELGDEGPQTPFILIRSARVDANIASMAEAASTACRTPGTRKGAGRAGKNSHRSPSLLWKRSADCSLLHRRQIRLDKVDSGSPFVCPFPFPRPFHRCRGPNRIIPAKKAASPSHGGRLLPGHFQHAWFHTDRIQPRLRMAKLFPCTPAGRQDNRGSMNDPCGSAHPTGGNTYAGLGCPGRERDRPRSRRYGTSFRPAAPGSRHDPRNRRCLRRCGLRCRRRQPCGTSAGRILGRRLFR
ncbi:hypothetical protein BN871_FG_00040 [Paenibacillus sp. P22]|nr:hypothetical protein BN871_FG_00040 [Paenibacillus sp. P22]